MGSAMQMTWWIRPIVGGAGWRDPEVMRMREPEVMSRRAVVCGIDDSECSAHAALVGAALGRVFGVGAVAVHAYDDPPRFPYGNAEARERTRHSARARALDVLAATQLGDALGVGLEARRGDAAEVLRAVAQERDAPLLAVGSRGRGPLGAALLGSVSSSLIRTAERPVLVVPPAAAGCPPLAGAAIACGVDGSFESRGAARFAADLARRLDARLVVVHARAHVPVAAGALAPAPVLEDVGHDRRLHEAVERVVQDVAGEDAIVHHVEAGSTAAGALADAAVSANASLLVVGDAGHGRVATALLGSEAHRLAASAPVPVLVVPPGAGAA